MTNPARFSYALLAAVLILVGLLQLGAPFLALLFSYFVLTKLGRFIPNKWVVLAVFIIVLAGISYTAGHFIRAAIAALPKIADNAIPAATAWAQARDFELPFTDFEGLKATAMTALKEEAHYLGNVANFARNASTTAVFLIIGVVAAVSLFSTVSSISFANPTRSETISTRLAATKSPRASASFTAASRRSSARK